MNILTKKSSIAPGMIRFLDLIEPPLKAGNYKLSATQSIEGVANTGGPEVPAYTVEKEFVVTGPRFTLKEDIVHSRYPAALASGSFTAALPNLVITDFSLPWARPIHPTDMPNKPAGATERTPWLGLLTLYPGEVDGNEDQITDTNKIIGPSMVSITELLKPTNPDVQPPALNQQDLVIPENTKVMVIDVDFKFFQSIAPTLEELEFLAHGREVNTDGKVMLGMDADGYFSLLVGNRLPQGGTPTEVAENRIMAVSYEGHANYLRNGQAPPKKLIRLVLLNSWKFYVKEAKPGFLAEMENLCLPGHGGNKLMRMPGDLAAIGETNPDVANAQSATQTVKKALEIGYTALQNDYRVGEKATSWYRGPLAAAPTKRDYEYGTYLYSDHAMHYDPDTGIFDHSYSAAWQIGRLLALSDSVFARGLFAWRNNYLNRVARQAANGRLAEKSEVLSANGPQSAGGDIVHGTRLLFCHNVAAGTIDWPQYENRGEAAPTDLEMQPGAMAKKRATPAEDLDPLLAFINR